MQRKNIILLATVILALAIFLSQKFRHCSPAWPGYGIGSFIEWRDPVLALTHVRAIDGTVSSPIDDLVVIKGYPSVRIADIKNVEVVFKDGIGRDSATRRLRT